VQRVSPKLLAGLGALRSFERHQSESSRPRRGRACRMGLGPNDVAKEASGDLLIA